MAKGKIKSTKKGKKKPKNKPTSKKYSKYTLDGDKITRNAKFCPRCGPGVFLMDSNNRLYCGKCHYSEYSGNKEKTNDSDKTEKKEAAEAKA